MFTSKPTHLILGSTSILFLFNSIAAAQTASVNPRETLTGRQLFEKEWTFTEPSQQSPSVSAAATQVDSLENDFAADDSRSFSRLKSRIRSFEDLEKATLSRGDGLGPMHNATSCTACHVSGGASGVSRNVILLTIDPRSKIVHQLKTGAETLRRFFPAVLNSDGTLQFEVVVHNYSARNGYESLRSRLAEYVPGGISDEWFVPPKRTVEAIASRPVVAGRFVSIDYYLSQRNAPPLYGVGNFQRISRKTLAAIAEKQARDSNGVITGRLAGLYGWRGQENSLSNFVAQACEIELGLECKDDFGMGIAGHERLLQIDDPIDPEYVNPGSDILSTELGELIQFVSAIPAPTERADGNQRRSELLAGEKLFHSIGCNSCHVADVHPVRGLFSDLLLHDMGKALQAPSPPLGMPLAGEKFIPIPKFVLEKPEQRPTAVRMGYGNSSRFPHVPESLPLPTPAQPQFPRGESSDNEGVTWDSLQREWRTAPLWGIADSAPYLHDGRAASIEEAIKWHGGESEDIKDRYLALSKLEKDQILGFLATLRAPGFEAD